MSRTFISAIRKRNIILSGLVVAIALLVATLAYAHVTSAKEDDVAASEPNGVSVLLALADTAFHEKRIVAPAGSNMFEFYLSVLELEPTNKLAGARLRSEFEPALSVSSARVTWTRPNASCACCMITARSRP
jgi:protein TonB